MTSYSIKNILRLMGTAYLMLVTVGCLAQNEVKQYSALSVGENIPNLQIKTFNYNANKVETKKISEYQGKYLILDLWNSGCLSCIEKFPHMEEIQSKYADKLNVILVNNYDKLESIKTLLNKRKGASGMGLSLTSIYEDSIIGDKLFAHKSIPHIAWISPDGKVLSITAMEAVNEKNIDLMLKGGMLRMKQKMDKDRIPFNTREPMFIKGNGGNGEGLQWSSQISSFIEGLPAGTCVISNDSLHDYYSALAYNCDIKSMYGFAYSYMSIKEDNGFSYLNRRLLDNRIEFHVNDTTKYVAYLKGEYQPDNLFTYQLLTPKRTVRELQTLMQEDLRKYFGLNANWQTKRMDCLVLTADDTTLISYKSGKASQFIDLYKYALNNYPVRQFIIALETGYSEYRQSPYPIIDETGFKGNIGDLVLECQVGDWMKLNAALEKYKMHLRLEKRDIKVLVLSEVISK